MALDDPNIGALDQVRTVWWRRPLAFAHRETEDHERRRYLDIQCEFCWTGFVALLPPNTVWYNDWRADHAADRNLLQLRVATELGFAIPDTLVSSSAEEAAAFATARANCLQELRRLAPILASDCHLLLECDRGAMERRQLPADLPRIYRRRPTLQGGVHRRLHHLGSSSTRRIRVIL
ncbi:hypothetical protein ACFKHW_29655 [Bradyrhizobium lupini]|uniref:hypothetical protein n=1 Tax=Rhizobium lupini TaxID=136996 RepID=UPI003672B83C